MRFTFLKRNLQFKVKRITYMSRANLRIITRKTCLMESFYSFADASKINGLYYLRKANSSHCSRIFWIAISLFLIGFAGVLIHLLAQTFFQNPILISHAAPTSLLSIPFPAITVCPFDPISPTKVRIFLEKSIIPDNLSKERIRLALPILNGFTQGFINGETEGLNITDRFLTANNLTVSAAMVTLGTECDDYIKIFSFDTRIFECTSGNCLKWSLVSTIHGRCCSFNFHPDNVSKSLFSNEWGKRSGVSVIFGDEGDATTRSGFNVFIHHPAEYITKATRIFSLIPEHEHFIRIYPRSNKPSEYFLSLPYESRRCLLPHERDLTLFRQSRCRLLELSKAIHQVCGCHPYFMPILTDTFKTIRNCTVHDIDCFKYDSTIWKQLSADCMPSCFDVFYKIQSSFSTLQNGTAVMELYKNVTQIRRPYTVHIFYGDHRVKMFEKILIITWIDLIANLGGILNLTLGISVISIFELFYYLTYKVIQNLQNRGNHWNSRLN